MRTTLTAAVAAAGLAGGAGAATVELDGFRLYTEEAEFTPVFFEALTIPLSGNPTTEFFLDPAFRGDGFSLDIFIDTDLSEVDLRLDLRDTNNPDRSFTFTLDATTTFIGVGGQLRGGALELADFFTEVSLTVLSPDTAIAPTEIGFGQSLDPTFVPLPASVLLLAGGLGALGLMRRLR